MIDINQIFDGTAPNTGRAITVSADSTNTIDFASLRDVGVGDQLELHVQILQTFIAAGAATLQIALQGSQDNSTFYDEMLSPVYAVADLVVGAKVFAYKFPSDQLNNNLGNGKPSEYYKLRYTVATGPMTAGKVFSFLTGGGDRPRLTIYGPNYTNNA